MNKFEQALLKTNKQNEICASASHKGRVQHSFSGRVPSYLTFAKRPYFVCQKKHIHSQYIIWNYISAFNNELEFSWITNKFPWSWTQIRQPNLCDLHAGAVKNPWTLKPYLFVHPNPISAIISWINSWTIITIFLFCMVWFAN